MTSQASADTGGNPHQLPNHHVDFKLKIGPDFGHLADGGAVLIWYGDFRVVLHQVPAFFHHGGFLMPTQRSEDDQVSAERRRDEALRRALNMPPQPKTKPKEESNPKIGSRRAPAKKAP